MVRGGGARRVAHVLTHRRGDAEAAPAEVLKGVVDRGLRSFGVAATVSATIPMRLQWEKAARATVTLVVPSRLRGSIQLACLQDVLARTAYPAFDMLVVVTQSGPLDQEQAQAAQLLERTGRARVSVLERETFNYSVANNVGVAQSAGEFVLLLNDDVSTLEPDWLDRMVAMMSDPAVGIVGAKLYYEDMTTQHGGVIIGLGGLADHVSRLLPRGSPGYMGRAVLDQEMSVVTGACLLVRRSIYVALGGLDEALASAFNDVDFCLRVRAAGHLVVFAGSVELVHHETISFGHHYAGRAEQEAIEVRRMQTRWADVCRADPFHNPNLSLVPGKEWTLAFPPRVDALSPLGDVAAT
jgi:GT2 family glycosyltransferase